MSPTSRSRFGYERELLARGTRRIAGVDEAGRGPLAGPVVAAAVILPAEWIEEGLPHALRGLNDSKQLTPVRREHFHGILHSRQEVCIGVAVVESDEIDRVNILRATHAAMVQALNQLVPPPAHVLVDGLHVDVILHTQTAIVEGDGLSYSIAAASVVAKVTRDALMVEHDRRWPQYGFAIHKGYPTPAHQEALRRHGPCPIHRRTFAPVSALQLDLFGS